MMYVVRVTYSNKDNWSSQSSNLRGTESNILSVIGLALDVANVSPLFEDENSSAIKDGDNLR